MARSQAQSDFPLLEGALAAARDDIDVEARRPNLLTILILTALAIALSVGWTAIFGFWLFGSTS